MKRGIYIAYDSSMGTAGVDRKIDSQIRAMQEEGIEVKKITVGINKIAGWKILYRLPFTNINPYWKWHREFEICDFLYIRYPTCLNFSLLRLLRKIKKRNPKVKIIMELHSGIAYRYLSKRFLMLPLVIKEWACMPFLKKYVDKMAALGDFDTIYHAYGINTIPIRNGMDFSTMKVRKISDSDGTINLVIVAMMCAAHGYERIINGLYDYYERGGGRNIVLHFVGEGEELRRYKELVSKYGLSAHVVFYGMRSIEEMQEIYSHCDIGVSALGLYKIKSDVATMLKQKEYIAVGLPVIGVGNMDIAAIPEMKKYVLQLPNRNESIEIGKVIQFYDDIYQGKAREEIKQMAHFIRILGEKYFDYKSAFRSVITFIQG